MNTSIPHPGDSGLPSSSIASRIDGRIFNAFALKNLIVNELG
jgi:hypothetical protein